MGHIMYVYYNLPVLLQLRLNVIIFTKVMRFQKKYRLIESVQYLLNDFLRLFRLKNILI